jgi:hypothetical protein
MKRFWLVLLSLGLILAFSVSAFAVDVKVSGEYYAAGLYLNKTSVQNEWTDSSGQVFHNDSPSTAFFYQRLRVGTDFIVSPSLKLVTRFDAMERIWGGNRSGVGTTSAIDSSGTRAENENIAIDWAYISYVSPIGTFDVGYMNDGAVGLIFGDSYSPSPRIKYTYTSGPAKVVLCYTKVKDQSDSAITTATWTDADNDKFFIDGSYKWKDVNAGLNVYYFRYAATRLDSIPLPNQYKKHYFMFTPYAKAQIGPVALQAEFSYATGKDQEYDNSTLGSDVRLEQMSAWIDATANFAPVYVGGTIAYVSGNDPGTPDVKEGGTLSGGRDWNPCLIMFNYYDTYNWVGAISGYENSVVNGGMSNAWFFQGRVGVKPTPQLDAMLSASYAMADKKPTGFANGIYGTEIDLTGTYKITNNLSYMLGVGYLFTGNYFKGYDTNSSIASTSIVDDFIIINKLTLSF